MVDITTVYDSVYKNLLYVYIDEEYLTLNTYDTIREEKLPADTCPNDYIIHCISQEYFTTDPSFDNYHMDEIDEDTAELFLSCMLTYIRNNVEHNKRNYFTTVDKLPNELHRQMTDSYTKWLESNDKLVETDGWQIIVDKQYFNETAEDTPNEYTAKRMLQHLYKCLPDGEDEQLMEKFYNEKLHIIYCGQLFTFENGADVYNGLEEFVKFVIDQQ